MGLALALTVGGGIAGLALLLYSCQGRLVFWPENTTVSDATVQRATVSHGAIELTVPGADGVELHGFLLPGREPGPRPTVLYFGGNAENVAARTGDFDELRTAGLAVALVCYRGYGRSTGRPSSRGILADAPFVYDAVAARDEVDAGRIYTWGRSLGTGVAAHVAAHRPVVGVILAAPFVRLSEVAAHHYPWLPVRRFFSHEIDTLAIAPTVDTPALILHGDCDTVIPYAQAERLAAAWRPPPRLVTLEGRGHSGLNGDPTYVEETFRFLTGATEA